MPSTDGIELLIREDQLTDEQWRDLIEARRQLIKPYLDSFTLPKLAALQCVRIEYHKGELHFCSKMTGDDRFSLKTQGIFGLVSKKPIPDSGYQAPPGKSSCPDGTMKIWGLTRGGLWVLVTVSYLGTYGWKGRGQEVPQAVEIRKVDLDTILAEAGADPQDIWEEIGKAVKSWANRSAQLYGRAIELAERVKTEDLMVLLISEK